MVVMTIVFFVRIYTHYSGMWLYVSAIGRGATVSNFDFKPYMYYTSVPNVINLQLIQAVRKYITAGNEIGG